MSRTNDVDAENKGVACLVDDEGLITGLYYVNDSDGDTFLFNEMNPHRGALTVARRITPKRGTLVLFDATRYHAGNNPIDHPTRLTLNFNFYPAGAK